MNLLQETIEAIKKSNHSEDDIVFIGSEETRHSCAWGEFKLLGDVEYDAECRLPQVATDLIIVFSDGSKLYRSWREDMGEWACQEHWEHSIPFTTRNQLKPISRLVVATNVDGYQNLIDLNE